jgi:hypothetical protein
MKDDTTLAAFAKQMSPLDFYKWIVNEPENVDFALLDNDDTHFYFIDGSDFGDYALGNQEGVPLLLEAIGIKTEDV